LATVDIHEVGIDGKYGATAGCLQLVGQIFWFTLPLQFADKDKETRDDSAEHDLAAAQDDDVGADEGIH